MNDNISKLLGNVWIKKIALSLANLFTLTSFVLATLGIIFSILYYDEFLKWFPKVIALCSILDFADGKLARIGGGNKKLLIDVDTIVDAIAFGLFPAIFITTTVMNLNLFAGFLTGLAYLVAVWFRLYRFYKRDPLSKLFFDGLPAPFAAMVIACLFIFVGTPPWAYIITVIAMAIFMISTTPFPSFKGNWSLFDLFWVITTTILVFAILVLPFDFLVYPAYILSLWMLFYLAFGPQYAEQLDQKYIPERNSEKVEN